jgi:hypothetical protein
VRGEDAADGGAGVFIRQQIEDVDLRIGGAAVGVVDGQRPALGHERDLAGAEVTALDRRLEADRDIGELLPPTTFLRDA